MKDSKITLTLEPELKEHVIKICKELDIPVSQYIRKLLREAKYDNNIQNNK